jgi:LPXTG-site transpeptidase (sortase) family protein
MRALERLLWVSGFIMLSIFFGHLALAEYKRTQSISAFKAQQLVAQAASIRVADNIPTKDRESARRDRSVAVIGVAPAEPDQSLWSAGRISSYAASLAQDTDEVVGIFAIPRLGLEVPLYEGASELHMDRGIARIEGTAAPGEIGNLGIAGHRDGYFRVLKDIQYGDKLILTSAHGSQTYSVQQLMIVDPSAVEVLDSTDEVAITLVTCYPFYFVGHAPERFIVRAVLEERAQAKM